MKGESVILRVLMSAVGVSFVAVAVALVVVSKPPGSEVAEGADALRETAWTEIIPASDALSDAGTPLPDASTEADALTDAATDGSTEDLAGDASAPDDGGLDGGPVVAAAKPVHATPLKAPAPSKKKPLPLKPKPKKPR